MSCRMMRITVPLAIATLLLTAGCNQKDLCFDVEEHLRSHVLNLEACYDYSWEYNYGGTDWHSVWDSEYYGWEYDDLKHPAPTGLRALVYNDDQQYSEYNLEPTGGRLPMTLDFHDILLYNNNTYYLVFNDLPSSMEATVTTRARSRNTYMGSSAFKGETDEITVNPPDALFGSYLAAYDGTDKFNEGHRTVTMRPLVFRYLIRWEFSHGLEYVGLGRGALAGMAEKVYLNDGHSGEDRVSVLFDCDVKPWGVEAVVNTFGAPGYPNEYYSKSRGEDRYGLNLELRLRNGKMLSYDFDITDQMKLQPRGGVIVIKDVQVSDEEGAGGAAGVFDIEVEGWGENQDIDIPF